MVPPEYEVQPPVGDLVPYPGDVLTLGGGRWLNMRGEIVPNLRHGHECQLTSQTLRYWEAAALRGQGVPLSELIV